MAAATSRYARAFADVVASQKLDAASILQQLHSMVALLKESADLREVWESPAIAAEQKRTLLDSIAARAGLATPVRNFIAVLMDHRRLPLLGQIVRQFELELDRRMGMVEAEITSSRELSDREKRELEGRMAKLTGKKVRAHYGRDAKILGGVVVRVGSTIYDGSVRGQLRKLKEQLSTS